MKFVIATLLTVATVSSIRVQNHEVELQKGPVLALPSFLQMGKKPSAKEEAENIVKMLDTDTSGTISWPEVEAYVEKMCEGSQECFQAYTDYLDPIFKAVDTSGDGEVSVPELETYIKTHHR